MIMGEQLMRICGLEFCVTEETSVAFQMFLMLQNNHYPFISLDPRDVFTYTSKAKGNSTSRQPACLGRVECQDSDKSQWLWLRALVKLQLQNSQQMGF